MRPVAPWALVAIVALASSEADDGRGLLVGVDLGVREPGVVVDDRMDDVESVVVAVLA
jgi:hypothetical protein